ncbi:MAG: hypothetical protein K2L48_04225 [Mycoplasmoidaceae bacterium]|nr:hypothetical protein [Mycoplasmoidaceae bacterium]
MKLTEEQQNKLITEYYNGNHSEAEEALNKLKTLRGRMQLFDKENNILLSKSELMNKLNKDKNINNPTEWTQIQTSIRSYINATVKDLDSYTTVLKQLNGAIQLVENRKDAIIKSIDEKIQELTKAKTELSNKK